MDIEQQPAAAEPQPWVLVVFAGESIWPGIQAVWQVRQAPEGVRQVCIMPTPSEPPTRGPAQRLQRWLEHHCAGTRVIPHAGLPAATAGEVRAVIATWQTENPGCRWLIDMTGATAAQALGCQSLVGASDLHVIFREPSGAWFELAPGEGGLEARPRAVQPAPETYPVADLIWPQLGVAADAVEIASAAASELPVKRLTQEGIARVWDWPSMFSACGLTAENPASALITYLGAGLREMGVASVALNLRLNLKRDRKEKLAIDLAASQGSQVVLLDLCLPANGNEEPSAAVVAHLRQLLETRQKLAGIEPQMVLLCPGRPLAEAERELAKVCGVEVVDQREAPRLFSKLADWLQLGELAAEMAEVEGLLIEQVAKRGRKGVFAPEDDRLRQQEADSGGPECIDVEAYLRRICVERGQNWLLYATRTEIILRLDRPDSAPVELPSLIQSALASFGRVRVETTASGYDAIFARESSRLAKLRQAFAGFVNRRLETMVFVQARPHRSAPMGGNPRPPAERPQRRTPPVNQPLNQPPLGYGSLEDLDAAVDQVFKPRPPKS